MDPLEKLMKQADDLLKAIDELRVKLEKPENDTAKADLEKQLKAKEAEFTGLESKIDEEVTQLERRKKLETTRGKARTVATGDVSGQGLAPLQAKDHFAEARAASAAFYKVIRGEIVEGKEFELIEPKSDKLRSCKKAAGGVVMPPSLAVQIFGKRWGYCMGLLDSWQGHTGYYEMMGKMADALQGKVVTSGTPLGTVTGDASVVPWDFRPNLLELPPEGPHMVQRATVVPAPAGNVTWPRLVQSDANEYGGVCVEWIEEASEKPETEPDFEQVQILCHEVAAYTEISDRMLSRSAIALEALLARLYRGAILSALDQVLVNGSGVGQPLGIVNTTGIRTVARATAGTVVENDFIGLKHAILPHHRAGAEWLLGDDIEMALELLTDAQRRRIFGSLETGNPTKIKGYPYEVSMRMPTMGHAGDVVYGLWREYILAMEQEVVVKRSEHYRFRHNRTAFSVFMVVGGRCVQPRAFSILGDES